LPAKGRAVRAAIRAAGAHLRLLPPYSPVLNPIEQVFAKLKHQGPSANRRRRNHRHRNPARHLRPQECANYLTNAGYAST
jgi:transposase